MFKSRIKNKRKSVSLLRGKLLPFLKFNLRLPGCWVFYNLNYIFLSLKNMLFSRISSNKKRTVRPP
nr:MAG TPA: hypothetical protein [Caudoviricetes sp.]